MYIEKKSSWYRPYYLTANNKEYKVNKIHFYKDDKILVSSNNAWLEKSTGADIDGIFLDVEEIKVKRKEKFDGTVFIISRGKEAYGTETEADLYIPAELLNIHFTENKIEYKTQIRAIYRGDNDIYISRYIKSLDDDLRKIRAEYDALIENCSGYRFTDKTENIIEDLEKLQTLAKQYLQEKQRIEALTIDDITL